MPFSSSYLPCCSCRITFLLLPRPANLMTPCLRLRLLAISLMSVRRPVWRFLICRSRRGPRFSAERGRPSPVQRGGTAFPFWSSRDRGHTFGRTVSPIQIFDVSVPASPQGVGGIRDFDALSGSFAVSGNYLYLSSEDGLRVFDVSSFDGHEVAFRPNLKGEIAVGGEYAVVADFDALHIVDISQPASPVAVGSLQLPGDLPRVAISGELVFVSKASYTGPEDHLYVIDISDPRAPRQVTEFQVDPGLRLRRVAWLNAAGNYVYVAASVEPGSAAGRVLIFDVSDPASPMAVGDLSFANALAIWGARAFLAAGTQLRVLDISVPGTPMEINVVSLSQ